MQIPLSSFTDIARVLGQFHDLTEAIRDDARAVPVEDAV